MNTFEILSLKRHGKRLSDQQIEYLISRYTAGEIPDYQMAAFAMAVCINGMDDRETLALTRAMAESGDSVDLSLFGNLSVDKHSTGGVGDKTTLIVTPIAAALGCKVAKMTGRALGHTGGTSDKLESIPGFSTVLDRDVFFHQVETIGIAVVAQSANLAPADKKLYALRDVTATIDSIPLIASSIMSKKLAAGAHNIVLDVKVGNGAFMKDFASAKALAEAMVRIGNLYGRNVTAVMSDMSTPLGFAVGNALEVQEAIRVLKGELTGDIREICLKLSSELLRMAKGISSGEATRLVTEALDSGAAYNKFVEWITAQGGDPEALRQPETLMTGAFSRDILSTESGYVSAMNAETIGLVSSSLGAGRAKKDDPVDPKAGILLKKKTGDYVSAGDVLCTVYSSDPVKIERVDTNIRSAYSLSDEPSEPMPLILDIVKG